MISVVIRNKNESSALQKTLTVLNQMYKDDIGEIIVVDNLSTDNSVQVAKQFNCKVLSIIDFTYGKALNLGIGEAKYQYVLLLSAHAVPIGNSFFITALNEFNNNVELAGLRFINSFSNYERAIKNNFFIKEGLTYGLMNACAMINKKAWEELPFNEVLIASEDKEWSKIILDKGYLLKDCSETFFYFPKRDKKGGFNRWRSETIAHYQLHHSPPPSITKLFLVFLKKTIWDFPLDYLKKIRYEINVLKVWWFLKNDI